MSATSLARTVDGAYLHPDLAALYLRVQGDEAAFVETCTARSADRAMEALDREGLRPEQVRYVVVTHAHLDHAGGAAALMQRCPKATLLAHPRAAKHLIDPSRLVASARAVYGAERFEALYGTIDPIEASRVRPLDDAATFELGGVSLQVWHTRGHANHHFIVHDPSREAVFTGDTFGLVYPRLQRAGLVAFPSTSPTDFDAAEALRSVDKVLSLAPKTVALTHFGERHDPKAIAGQLRAWLERSAQLVREAATRPADEAYPFLLTTLTRAMDEALAAAGTAPDAADRTLLAIDLDLNAQGLAFAASKLRAPAPASPAR